MENIHIMKFTAGGWQVREDVIPIHPKYVFEHIFEDGILLVRAIDRNPTEIYDGKFLTVRISSPIPDVVNLRVTHYEGVHKPLAFPIEDKLPKPQPEFADTEDSLIYTTGQLLIKVSKAPWDIQFYGNGKLLTSSNKNSLGFMHVLNEGDYMIERLDLGIGQCIYGGGERFGPFVKNGQSITIWNNDGGTWSDWAYKNIPFIISNGGWGLLVNSTDKVEFEVATDRCEQVGFSVPGQTLDYYFIYGPTPKEILEKYTILTGRPALPPVWSFGLWLTTSFVTKYNEEIVTEFVEGMQKRGIPLSVFHYDCSWMKDYHWCDFEWDDIEFPDPQGMLHRLKSKGLRVCVWINPYISQFSSMFAEGVKNGYFLKRKDGSIYQVDWWQPGCAFVDFTNPDAVKWYQSKLRKLLDMGVDTFKTDFGEGIPEDAVYFDGSDARQMHNFYTYLYNKAVFDLLEEYYGKGNAVVFARSATAGCQKFPVHWGGDCKATFQSMAEELRGGLSFAMSGGAFWSHDIGGFVGTASPELYKRWVAWGLFSSHSRLHGNDTYRVPWLFDEESVDVLRFFAREKNRLMPYLYQTAVEAHTHGWPMMRPMIMEFPNDRTCRYIETQYMLGSSLLVAPVLQENGAAEYYLPDGIWTNYFTGQIIQGGRWFQEQVDVFTLPVFVRENRVLPIGYCEDKPDYDFTKGIELRLFQIADGSDIQVIVPHHDGSEAAVFKCVRNADTITVNLVKGTANWHASLNGTTYNPNDKDSVVTIKL